MNIFTISILIVVLVSSVASYLTVGKHNTELDSHWKTYKTLYKKQYSEDHEFVRRLIWESNLKHIQKHNLEYDLGRHTYSLGMNAFGDLTFEEFKLLFLTNNVSNLNSTKGSLFLSSLNLPKLPDSVDWRNEGYVTEVKNQGKCGSCWAFSATGAIEGQYYRKTGNLENFSEQQLVDCSGEFDNHGCHGGSVHRALRYIKEYGIERETDYSYQAEEGECVYASDMVVTQVTGYVDIPRGDEVKLKEAVATVGPVSVSIDASRPNFHLYKNGVYNEPECSSTHLNHAVLVVGYGELNGTPYWTVKNSWGTSWGDNGYIYMSRDMDNQCGIATRSSYPLL